MTREERDEMIWLYAAGALSEAEVQSVRALLEEGDAEDLVSLSAARETLAHLPEALDGVDPSDEVLARVMKRIDPAATTSVAPAPRRSSRHWILPTLLTAAAALAAIISVMDAKNLRNENNRVQEQLDQSLSALESMRSQNAMELADLRKQMDEQRVASARQLDALAAQNKLFYTANLQFTALQGEVLPRGAGRVIWDMASRKSHLFVFDLVPLPEGKVYELWFIEPDNAAVPAGTFTVDAQGRGGIISSIPEGMKNIQTAAITIEPAGGSATPTMPIVLTGNHVPAQ